MSNLFHAIEPNPFSRAQSRRVSLISVRIPMRILDRKGPQPGEVHQLGSASVRFFNPGNDLFWIGWIFELDRNDPVHLQFLDGLQIGREFDDAAARWQVPMDLAV